MKKYEIIFTIAFLSETSIKINYIVIYNINFKVSHLSHFNNMNFSKPLTTERRFSKNSIGNVFFVVVLFSKQLLCIWYTHKK